jgi:RNA polymerase sigma-70 factor (family 1)
VETCAIFFSPGSNEPVIRGSLSKRFNTEDQAFDSFRKGDAGAFMYFFDQYFPALSFFAYSLLRDQGEAEDVADECFLKAWDQHHQFSSPENLKAFLYRVGKNACIDLLRRRKTMAAFKKESQYDPEKMVAAADQKIIYAEMLSEILGAMHYLSPKCRQVLQMLFIEGKTPKEVSAELGISINTVRVQKARGIELLRNRLGFIRLLLLF